MILVCSGSMVSSPHRIPEDTAEKEYLKFLFATNYKNTGYDFFLKSYIPVILIRSYLTVNSPSAFRIIIQGESCPGNTAVAFEFNYNCISGNINCTVTIRTQFLL